MWRDTGFVSEFTLSSRTSDIYDGIGDVIFRRVADVFAPYCGVIVVANPKNYAWEQDTTRHDVIDTMKNTSFFRFAGNEQAKARISRIDRRSAQNRVRDGLRKYSAFLVWAPLGIDNEDAREFLTGDSQDLQHLVFAQSKEEE
jgi:hypothetical protein